jgi:hypothetical protein
MAGGGSGPRGRSEFRAEVTVTGATETADMLRMMGARAYNTLPLMEVIKEKLFQASRERVQSAPWAPLKGTTIARKISQGEDPSILRDEWRPIRGRSTRVGNKLYLALTLDGATDQVKVATRTWAVFGVNAKGNNPLFYARFVQNVKGTKRKILAINQSTALEITEGVGAWIRFGEGAGQAGFLRGSFGFKGSPTRGK